MQFVEYKRGYDQKIGRLTHESGAEPFGPGCTMRGRPAMPPWMMGWGVRFRDGRFLRVKEYYVPNLHPNYADGVRKHFSYHYGVETGIDRRRGLPFSRAARDTVLRLDLDDYGAHLHYQGHEHIQQSEIGGSFRIADAEAFEFIDAVFQHRASNEQRSLADILGFKLLKGSR